MFFDDQFKFIYLHVFFFVFIRESKEIIHDIKQKLLEKGIHVLKYDIYLKFSF